MKKFNYTFVFICSLFVLSAVDGKSQNQEVTFVGNKSSIEKTAENWHPIKISETTGNVLKGVSFLSRELECTSQGIIALKLINSNPYTVIVSCIENGIKKSITIPASSQLEGACESFFDTNKKNATKILSYLKPVTSAEKQAKENIVSTIVVEKAD